MTECFLLGLGLIVVRQRSVFWVERFANKWHSDVGRAVFTGCSNRNLDGFENGENGFVKFTSHFAEPTPHSLSLAWRAWGFHKQTLGCGFGL
jgi:hypothetical protein